MGSETEASSPPLICPTCSLPLAAEELETTWTCASGHRYPVMGGILDCRPSLEGFDTAADRRLAEELAGSDGALEELLRIYWDRQPDVPEELVSRFVTGDLIGAGRAAAVADQIEGMRRGRVDRGVVALEVGAGTAALGAELARRAGWVVATDVSLAWLVIARRRLVEAGLDNISLVAATGDVLPFPEGAFDLVVAADVIEHVPDAAGLVGSCHRVLKPGGVFWLSTPNRYSLTPEPHVRVWGVGLVPRRWANAYVGWVRGVGYDDIHTLSRGELHRLLSGTGGEVEVAAPAISGSVTSTYTPIAQRLIRVYNAVQRVAVLRRLLLWVTPLFHAIVRRRPANV